jgi:GT2 family glycosyltransferase
MDVSIIIVNYNTRQLTLNCINSVFEKTNNITFELILIDNLSTDGSIEEFRKDTRITFIESNDNLGFGRANNIGIGIAKGRNLLFLNSDTLLLNNAVKILSDYLDEHNDIGSCGGNLYNENLQPANSFFRFFPGFVAEVNELTGNRYEKIRFGKNHHHNFKEIPIEVSIITGADLMVKKNIIEKVGPFDADFFMFYEETEFCFRIKKTGYKIYSIPEAKIIHFESKSFEKHKDKLRIYYSSRQIFYYKTYSKFKIIVLNGTFKFHYRIRAFLAKQLRQLEKYNYYRITLQIYSEVNKNYCRT